MAENACGHETMQNAQSPTVVEIERSRSFSMEGHRDGKFLDETYKYSDWNASSMGVNRNGRYAILAARRGFLLVDFNEPSKPKKFVNSNKWEPGSLEWNPHPSGDELFASVMNQKIEIWNANELSSGIARHTLSSHTRAISDINWNYFDPSFLLTCSMDTYINLWDLRTARKPTSTFTTVAGSSQVKWNRKNPNLFASAHDGDVRIWDIRKGNIPSIYIAGHLSKIHGLDWSPQKENFFVTASNDSTVKFWNMSSPKQPRASINNGGPVWKARYTPFGNGLVTVLVPQLRRSENTLFLWNTSEFKNPIHKFDGHTDVILEFQWRAQRIGNQDEYQLVSWSKDQTLRLWTAEKKTVQAITGEIDKPQHNRVLNGAASPISPTPLLADRLSLNNKLTQLQHQLETSTSPPVLTSTFIEKDITRKTSEERPESLMLMNTRPFTMLSHSTMMSDPNRALSPLSGQRTVFRKQGVQSEPLLTLQPLIGEAQQYKTLKQEFALINHNNPLYKIDKMDAENRVIVVSTKLGLQPVKLQISFPLTYPDQTMPQFQFKKEFSSTADVESKTKILKSLEEISQQHVKFSRSCVEPCLHQLSMHVDNLKTQDSIRSDDSLTPMTPPPTNQSFTFQRADAGSDSSYKDSTVPFPRTCGARFCGVGDRLVVFARPEKFNDLAKVEGMFRSISALRIYLQNLSKEGTFDDETPLFKTPKAVGCVYVSDTSSFLPVSKYLSEHYVLNGDNPSELCLKNAALAQTVQRKDLVQAWTLLSKIMSPRLLPQPNIDRCDRLPWACHPFGKKLVQSLFDYYENNKDIQMLALMSCMLAKQMLPDEIKDSIEYSPVQNTPISKKPMNSDGLQVSPDFPYNVYNKLSSSGDDNWSPPTFVEEKLIDPKEDLRKQHIANCRLFEQEKTFRYDQFKRYYSEILYRWNFTTQRTEVTKYITEQPERPKGLDICLTCCKQSQRDACCNTCKSIIVKCSVCRIGVRGLLSFCMVCGHGGHMFHVIDWFRQNDWCATGCGCYCLRIGKFSSD